MSLRSLWELPLPSTLTPNYLSTLATYSRSPSAHKSEPGHRAVLGSAQEVRVTFQQKLGSFPFPFISFLSFLPSLTQAIFVIYKLSWVLTLCWKLQNFSKEGIEVNAAQLCRNISCIWSCFSFLRSWGAWLCLPPSTWIPTEPPSWNDSVSTVWMFDHFGRKRGKKTDKAYQQQKAHRQPVIILLPWCPDCGLSVLNFKGLTFPFPSWTFECHYKKNTQVSPQCSITMPIAYF